MDLEAIRSALDFAVEGIASGSAAFFSKELLTASKKLFKRLRKTGVSERDLSDLSLEEIPELARAISEASERDAQVARLLENWLAAVDDLRTGSTRSIKQSSVSIGFFSKSKTNQTIKF